MFRGKKIISIMLTLALICSIGSFLQPKTANAATTITGNNSMATAYNYGTWQSAHSNTATAILESGQNESWFKFTVAAGESIYIRSGYNSAYEGMSIELRNASNGLVQKQEAPDDVYNPNTISSALYLNCDNIATTGTQTFYLVVRRGTATTENMYFGFNLYNRIRTGQGTFSFTGTASNAGNSAGSLSGVNSSELSLDLSNDTKIPQNAIVTDVSTSGTQSPSQGNVRHMIMPTNNNSWYTSIVSSAGSGRYSIVLGDNMQAKQVWKFKYNALASAKSTMSKVTITIKWQYDMKDTNYEIFIN